ncbi:MAG: DUF3486 family protein [Deltaproteobacteria bacterium]|nr:DUF3486 family protein [Deltaproteobacteria bacterium]
MPQRSAVTRLPDDIRAELNRRLVQNGFADYQGLADWLADLGYEISKSSIHRYGQNFDNRLAALTTATAQAKAVTEVVGDEEGAMNEALIRLVQEKLFDVLVNLQIDDPDSFAKVFPKLGLMVARLGNASVKQKQWQAEARKKAKSAARAVDRIVRQTDLPPEKVDEIQKKILGIV